jgi:hypothetical protein
MTVMKNKLAAGAAILALALGTEAAVDMGQHADGTFEVKVTPVTTEDPGAASARLSLSKTFTGDLTGTSRGDMWTAETTEKDSRGYVAIEKFEGTLGGRRGSFKLLHQGTMRGGSDFQLRIVVVPGSGTEQLAGLAGTMTIRIDKGTHFYDFDYALPASQ